MSSNIYQTIQKTQILMVNNLLRLQWVKGLHQSIPSLWLDWDQILTNFAPDQNSFLAEITWIPSSEIFPQNVFVWPCYTDVLYILWWLHHVYLIILIIAKQPCIINKILITVCLECLRPVWGHVTNNSSVWLVATEKSIAIITNNTDISGIL